MIRELFGGIILVLAIGSYWILAALVEAAR
jgi:hypothetical protein